MRAQLLLSQAFMIIGLAALGTGCVTSIPVEEFALARAAYDAAKDADAPRYAPGLWYKADDAYKTGQKQFKDRDYSAAGESFDQARFMSEKAENAARLARVQSGGVPP